MYLGLKKTEEEEEEMTTTTMILLTPPIPPQITTAIIITTTTTTTTIIIIIIITTLTVAGAGVGGGPRVGMLWHSEVSQHMHQLILGDLTARNSSLAHSQVEGPALPVHRPGGACGRWHRGGG
jgi:hypothetical protein